MAWHAVPPRASEQDQHQGREQQPQCRGALRAHNGEDLLGQRGAQRQRRHRAQQPQDGLQRKGRRGICRRLGRSSRRIHEVRAESGKGSVRTPGPIMIKRMMWIPSGAARWPYHCRESVADLTTRSLLSRHASRMGTASPTAACRMHRGRARPACHGGRGCWAGGQKSSYNARHAGVAQLVERRLPKPEVASSRLVARSTFPHRRHHRVGGHGVQAHGLHPKVRSRRHPGRFPAAAARAFQRQAPVSSPPVSLATLA